MRGPLAVVTVAVAAVAATCGSGGADASPAAQRAKAGPHVVARGLHVPWGIAFLPSGAALVTERTTGKLVRIPPGGGAKRTVMTIPGVDKHAEEGGLLGLAASPHYARDRLLYAYYTTSSDNRIVRFKLGGKVHPILTGLRRGTCCHNGGRIAFGPDGKLYATVGETANTPQLAQDLSSDNGKILRLNPDGSRPRSNPFKGSLVWTWGHRNPQGLAWDAKGRLWSAELGDITHDEVNLIRKGRNYGWPVREGRGSTAGGKYVNPKVTWTPTSSCSPSGDAIIHSRLYVACLAGQDLWRIPLHGTRVGKRVKVLGSRYGRLRTVVKAPSGRLWITTSNRDGRGDPRRGDDKIISLKVP